jgi:hypothetical protein
MGELFTGVLEGLSTFQKIEFGSAWGRLNLLLIGSITAWLMVGLWLRYRLVSKAIQHQGMNQADLLAILRELGAWKPVVFMMSSLVFCVVWLWFVFRLLGRDPL